MRKFLIAVAIILVVLIAVPAIFLATFDVNHYRGTIQSQLEQRLDRKVSLGEIRLNVFPPRFQLQNLAIADDPAFASTKPFVQTQQLAVSVRLIPLLSGNVEIDSLDLERPSVELIRDRKGVWNFASLGTPSPASGSAAHPAPVSPAMQPSGPSSPQSSAAPAKAQSAHQFSLARLSITDGQLAVTDLQAGKPRTVYDHIDASLLDFSPGAPFSFDVAAHLPGQGQQEIRAQGQAGPIAKDQLASTPFRGTLNLKQVQLAGLREFLSAPALAKTDGILSGETKLSSESGKLAATGKINVQNPKLAGLDLGYPITAEYDLTDDFTAERITVRNTTLTLGTTPVVLDGWVNTKPAPPELDLRLKAANVSIAEVAKLAAASGIALTPGASVAGTMSADIQAKGPADKPAFNGTFSGRDVQVSGKEIPLPVSVRSINLSLSPTEILSDRFNVTSGGTNVAAQFALQQYLSSSPLVNASLQATDAGLPEVLSIAKAYGVTGLDKISGSGKLNMDMHAAGPLQSFTSGTAVKTLNGTLNLNLNNLRYTGTDVAHELATLGGYAKSSEKDRGYTDISRLTGDIPVKNGIAQTNNLLAQLDIGTVAAVGTANLVDQTLNLRLTAVLTREFSQKVGGAAVGGFMTTALANDQGELVIPAIVTGTFQNPKYSPDVEKMAQMKLKGLVPTSSNPLGAFGGLLGQKKSQQAQQPGQQQLPDAVQELENLFGKKKKPKPPSPPQP
jgi:AsmA protein